MEKQEEMIISMAGLIGAGKTTLAEKIAQKMKLPIYYELENDEIKSFLEKYYQNMKRWAFPLQMKFLYHRSQQYQKIISTTRCGVIDRSIYEDQIFARILHEGGLIADEEYKIYLDFSKETYYRLIKPKCIIYLKVSPDAAYQRIQKRNREMEVKSSGLTLEYLQQLYKGYESFIEEISSSIPVIEINWEDNLSNKEIEEKVDEITKRIGNLNLKFSL